MWNRSPRPRSSPATSSDFRLIFDAVSPDWDGAYPEIRILRVETK